MKLLELFSGTHSIGKVCKEKKIDVVSLDRDLPNHDKSGKSNYISPHHIKEDILTWDYKKDFKPYDFDIITASPSCFYWSPLRKCWYNAYYNRDIGKFSRTPKEGYIKFTPEVLQEDIELFGKPQVDKVMEILDYFNPKYWWIENPKGSSMSSYITDKPFFLVSYCKYGFSYQKHTRIWTNIPTFVPKYCKNVCENMYFTENSKGHKGATSGNYSKRKHAQNNNDIGGGSNRLERYRLPPKLISDLLDCCL